MLASAPALAQETPLSEVVVGLTDYLLTLESAVFVWILKGTRGGSPEVQRSFVAFFGFMALASLTGGTYHILSPNPASAPAAILWKATVVSIGAVAFSAWSIGACLLFVHPARGRVVTAALIAFLAYSIYVVAIDDSFWVAMVNYVPAILFLGIAFVVSYLRRPEPPVLTGLLGLGVTCAAAAVQRLGLSIHPLYFNHNATYHLVQAVGLFLIFLTALFLARTPYQTTRS